MHGDSAGVESADTRGASDTVRQWRDALSAFNAAAKAAHDLGEHKLQREAEDAAARCISGIEILEAARAARERLGRSEKVHGQDPQAAEVNGGFHDTRANPLADPLTGR